MKSNKQRYKEFTSNQKGSGQPPSPGGGFFFGLVIALIISAAIWYAIYYGVHSLNTLLGLN